MIGVGAHAMPAQAWQTRACLGETFGIRHSRICQCGYIAGQSFSETSVCALGRFPLSEMCFSVSRTGTWTLSRFKNVPKKRCSFIDIGLLCDGRCFGTQVRPSGISMIVACNDNDNDTLR